MTMWLTVWLAFAIAQAAGMPPQAQTCEIRGRITDRDTGLPIPRAVIRVRMEQSSNEYVARADADGRYRITGLPAGAYHGFVQAGEFRATHQMQFLQDPARGRLGLEPGEVRTGIDVALQRTLAITVRVIDEWGQPLSGVAVVIKSADTGRQAAGGFMGSGRTTDDRGNIRVYGLMPGRYIVCADVNQAGFAPAGGGERRDRFLLTCAPSAATAAEAVPVRLARADVDGVTIQMRRGRTFTISGTILDASGAPADTARLGLGVYTANSSSSRGIHVAAGGRFTIANVAPGEYALEASLGGPDRPEHRRDLEVAFQPIKVDASDLEDVVLTMAKGVEVAGRIVLEDPSATFQPPPRYAPPLIHARLADNPLPGSAGIRHAYPGEDRVFSFDGMFGRRLIDVLNVPPGWYVKSISYKGRDIYDVPTEFAASKDPSWLEVLVSKRGAVITGRALDERGNPVRGARVIVLPANPSKWGNFNQTSASSSAAGDYRIGPLRRGEYLVFAVESVASMPSSGDRDQMARFAKTAERITLVGEEERTLDVRVVR